MSTFHDQGNQGPAQLRKPRPSLTGNGTPPTRVGSTANDSPSSTGSPPSRHTRSHSFFSFGSKKSAQEQTQMAMESVQSSTGQNGSEAPIQRRASLDDGSGMGGVPPIIQREIKSVVDLAIAHSHKIYFAGPLVRRIERLPDGNKPTKDEGWVDVWAQLGGTTLSVWDMKAIEEASKRGEEVPPSYINITDSFVQVLGALTSPATPTSPAKRYTNVITINTAGSNLIFFACPSSAALVSWASAIRLASWEKSRLEEIYTGHLLRMSLSDGGPWREPATTLNKGRLEGEVKVRIAGHTDWKPMWMALSLQPEPLANSSGRPESPVTSVRSRNRMSNLFGRSNSTASQAPAGPMVPVISFYLSQKLKDRRKPVLTIRYLSQAFAVYPERPEVIQRSTLIKLEGILGQEELGGPMRGKESWLMIMPETQQPYPVLELIKWLIAIHDLFGLYGRPQQYVWDPLQPASMWFAYPVGAQRAQLFLDREMAERLDPRDDRTSAIRRELRQLLVSKLFGPPSPGGQPQIGKPVQPQNMQSFQAAAEATSPPSQGTQQRSNDVLQLPPLNFETQPQQQQERPTREQPPPDLRPEGQHSQQPPQYTQQPSSPPQRPEHTRSGSFGLSTVQEERSRSSTQTPISPPSATSTNGRTGPLGPNYGNLMNTAGSQMSRESSDKPPVASPSSSTSAYSQPMSPLGAPPARPDLRFGETSYFTAPPTSVPQSPEPTSSGRNIVMSPLSLSASPPLEIPALTPSPPLEAPSVLAARRSPSPPFQPRPRSPPFAGRMASPPRNASPSPLSRSFSPEQRQQSPQAPPAPPSKDSSVYDLPAQSDLPPPRLVSNQNKKAADVSDLANEAGVLFLLQEQQAHQPPARQQDRTATWHSDSDSDGDGPEQNPPPRRAISPSDSRAPTSFRSIPDVSQSEAAYAAGPSRTGVGRRPSGARAKPTHPHRHPEQASSGDNLSSSIQSIQTPTSAAMPGLEEERSELPYDDTADALAALSFLERNEDPSQAAPAPQKGAPLPPSPMSKEDLSTPTNEAPQYRSSFAPSRQAAERKAKAIAQQEAAYTATHQPGKPKGAPGKQRSSKPRGAWAESSDEEEEEDEEDDDDDNSDEERPKQAQVPQPSVKQPQPVHANDPRASVYPSAQPGGQGGAFDSYGQRMGRTLPQPPSRQESFENHPRVPPAQQDDRHRLHPDEPRGHTLNPHIAARQSVWSSVLDPHPPAPKNPSGRDTFVNIEDSETMTKPFQPQGLLSAGLADKEDRSAKRQEELARESGVSLINVPNKPPPPQTGLLGAITAHERERKREGGVGAALTERERERRLAEERQRKLDEMQRQQLDQMSQGGFDAFGQQGAGFPGMIPGFDPRMSMNPMMLSPFMGGGYPMMQFTPQQMMAAQMAAQQAYQQAMMTFSQAGGSQLGVPEQHTGASSPAGGPGASPAGSPSPMQGMMGMDPRMSMNMNPWMGMMGMGMGGMSPMGQMSPMGGMGMNPMGMMDPRMSMAGPQGSPFPQRPDSSPAQGQGRIPSYQATPSPRDSSPAPQRSSNNSPRPPAA